MTAFSLFMLIVIFSILVANLANIVIIDNDIDDKLKKSTNNHETSELHLNNGSDHIMWFVQISDLHISKFSDESRITQLYEFVNQTLDIIKPTVVLASGDLTDGKEENLLGSRQHLDEWKIYKNILSSNKVWEKTVWLDIRGNHDNFNVPDINAEENYFNKFSIQGGQHQKSYLYQTTVRSDTYSFIGIDACLDPGPKRPFNFIGLLDSNEINRIIELNENARKNNGKYSIWFGHYPTSCILSAGTGNRGLRKIIGNYDESYVYLCGHLHTQGGLITNMYTLQKDGFLELELGDWKSNRLFRVAAFDHGLFSVADVQYNDYPIILITNPKDALLNLPNKENKNLQLNSSHIRLLVFTPSNITYCGVKIENGDWNTCIGINENLFVVPWTPKNYKYGIHYLTVKVKTLDGKVKQIRQPFSLDGTKLSFNLLSRFILMIDITQLFQALFGIALFMCVVPLCILRLLHELVLSGKMKKPRIKSYYCRDTIQKLWILSSLDRIFMPIIIYCVYIAIGPWSFGDVIDNFWSVVFVWGIFVNNSYIPGTLTYLYGFFQLMFCTFPLIFVYANSIRNRYLTIHGEKRKTNIIKYFKYLPFIVIIGIEIVLAIIFWWAYGTVAFVVGPFRTWSVILHITLFYLAENVPEKSLIPATTIWNP